MDSGFESASDPIDEEVARLLADPVLRARLEAFEERLARGELGPGIPHEEVRRRLGMDGPADAATSDGARASTMAVMAATADPIPDPIDEELEKLLEHPIVRERLDDYERRRAEGRLGEGIPHNEVRRRLGLPPQEPEPPPSDA